MINNEQEIDDLLSRPDDRDVSAMAALDGDLLILGAGGKMGPTLALRAQRAMTLSGAGHRVIAVSRFSKPAAAEYLRAGGIKIIAGDLLDQTFLKSLPSAPHVIFMAAMKFGTTGAAHETWAMNTYLPGLVAERFGQSRIVAFSTGNVYPLVPVTSGGAKESTPVAPVGEYAWTALGRERMFEYASRRLGTCGVLLRLNYANELRYGVLLDIGTKVHQGRPVDLSMGFVNVIWQGDANSACLRAFDLCQSPPLVLNLTGTETLAVRDIAREFAHRFGVEASFEGIEAETALLSDATLAAGLLGEPMVSVGTMIEWIAEWIEAGGATLGKPTHFEVRDGKF